MDEGTRLAGQFADSAILQTTLSLVKVCLALRLTVVTLYGMMFVPSLHVLVSVLLNNVCFFLVENRLPCF
jgi:hypothetical protein